MSKPNDAACIKGPRRFTFCQNAKCKKGAPAVLKAFQLEAEQAGLELKLEPTLTICSGTCSEGPFVGMPERELFYRRVGQGTVSRIIKETVLGGRLVFPHLLLKSTKVTDARVVFSRQDKVLVTLEPDFNLATVAAYLFEFNAAESCGKCFPCRLGVHRVDELVRGILSGQAQAADVDELEQLTQVMSDSAYCRFAEKATAPLRLALTQKGQFSKLVGKGVPPAERRFENRLSGRA